MQGLVSILVLMELPYQRLPLVFMQSAKDGFNPCFNGIAISTVSGYSGDVYVICFNPCFNGIAIST